MPVGAHAQVAALVEVTGGAVVDLAGARCLYLSGSASADVLRSRHSFQVFRVPAGAVAAQVVDLQPVRYRAHE
jgi:hypothetical protein